MKEKDESGVKEISSRLLEKGCTRDHKLKQIRNGSSWYGAVTFEGGGSCCCL
uniref:Uncharacterized protein n=1 Tax=Medicago truncatula TaxID=3880 RepID=Q2HT33_MEDTR|nr:hypothetical protein MtrDRAFT_AC150798g16v2 [Medicago truncatula]